MLGLVASVAPMIAKAIVGDTAGKVTEFVVDKLGMEKGSSAEDIERKCEENPELLVKLKNIESDERAEIERLAAESGINLVSEVNQTMREELQSGNAYQKSWRPSFAYVTMVSVGSVVFVCVYAFVKCLNNPGLFAGTTEMVEVMLSNLIPIFIFMFSVLGVYTHNRTKEKLSGVSVGKSGGFMNIVKKLVRK